MRKVIEKITGAAEHAAHKVTNVAHKIKKAVGLEPKYEFVDETPTTWSFATTTEDSWRMLQKAFNEARESIYIEQFLFFPDTIGQQFIELLIKKARAGIHVKIIVDSVGSFPLGRSMYLEKMEEAGIKIKFFNWMLPFSKNSKKLWYFRNHRRLFIIDRSVLLTGGTCIGSQMTEWRETQIQLEGPAVQQAVKVFDQTWKKVYKKRTLNLGIQYKSGIDGFSYITQAPLPSERHVYYRLIDAIRSARKRVWLTTPYFLPDSRLERVLVLATKRKVDVRILTPKETNHMLVNTGSHTYYDHLLQRGVKIYNYLPCMLHSKTAVIDDEWAMVGTMNLDNISLRYNFESALIISNNLCVSELAEHFEHDLKKSEEITLTEWRKRPLLYKIKEAIVWPIRKFL